MYISIVTIYEYVIICVYVLTTNTTTQTFVTKTGHFHRYPSLKYTLMNNKWMHLIKIFDLTQLLTSSTCVTQSSLTIIGHVYTSNPENITETFVPYYAISDHFPFCHSRKVNAKISKPEHITTSYRYSKKIDETFFFLKDLSSCLEYFKSDWESVDEDFAA